MEQLFKYIILGCRITGIPIRVDKEKGLVSIYASDWFNVLEEVGVYDEDGCCKNGNVYSKWSSKVCREIYYRSGLCKELAFIDDVEYEDGSEIGEVYRWLELDGGKYFNDRYMAL